MRMAAARILVALGALLAVLSLLAGYIRFQGLDTETVQETAGDLIADDEIRDQVAASLVEELFTNVDVAAELEQRLPTQLSGLAAPAAAGLREFSDRAAERMLERPRVQALWVRTVTLAHTQLISVLEDDVGPLSTEGGSVVLDLQPLVIQLGDRVAIVGDVAETLGPDAGRIEIMEAQKLETAQDLTQILKILGTWLWIVPLVLWGIALWLARGRRRSILRTIAIGSILAGLLVLVVRRLAGSFIVEELVPSTAVQPAAQNAWDILTSLLRDGGFTLLGLGVILLVAVWLVGPVDKRRCQPERPRAVPGSTGDRFRGRRASLPAPALVEPDRPDDSVAADGGGGDPSRAGRRAAASPIGPGGSRPAAR